MKTILVLLLATGLAYSQPSVGTIRRDSVPNLPHTSIPILRPRNDFYRNPNDPANVVRATLDNMPVMGVDPSTQHTMLQAIPLLPKNRQPPQLQMPKLAPLLPTPVEPKKQ